MYLDSGILAILADVLPVSQVASCSPRGSSDQEQFEAEPARWLVLIAWATADYGALALFALRREL